MSAPTDEVRSVERDRAVVDDGAAGAGDDRISSGSGQFVAFLDLDEPAKPSVAPRSSSRWWRLGFPAALVVLVLAVPPLVWAGVQVVLQSNHGRLISSTKDPSQPGWEAAVAPTSTAVVATVSATNDLSSVNLLALSTDGSGTIVFVPADTQVPSTSGVQTLFTSYASGGAAGSRPRSRASWVSTWGT